MQQPVKLFVYNINDRDTEQFVSRYSLDEVII